MTAQELRNSILQLAIEGKLTDQREEDGTAEELYKEIQKEKAKLIKEKKIKKEKPLPEISEDEIPFEIPENWKWVRLGNIGQIISGGTPKTTVVENWENGNIPWITPADMRTCLRGKYIFSGARKITQLGLDSSSARLMPEKSILYSSRAPIGYIAISGCPVCTNQGFKSVVPYVNNIELFVYYVLIAITPEIIKNASGTTFKEISGTKFSETIIPLPPLKEQERIVEKLEQLLPLCDKLVKNNK